MRRVLTMVTMAALWGGLVSCGMAEDPKATKSPDNDKVAGSSATAATADLRAEIHRTLAALIEARSAEKPDEAKVGELTQKLQQLRGKLRGQDAASVGNATAGRGGPGPGYGRGAGRGGAGRGAGFGPGGGRGWGGGAGRGQGFGPGAGQGRAPGGPAFVDRDNDGVCDNYELRQTGRR